MNYVELLESVGPADPITGCREWLRGKQGRGYGMATWEGRRVLAHRLAYELARGPIPDGHYVCHKCDNPGCVEHTHLFTGTQRENIHDCIAKGRKRVAVGTACGSAKLTDEAVASILARYRPWDRKNSLHVLGREYGVDHKTVSRIVRGEGWKHIQRGRALLNRR